MTYKIKVNDEEKEVIVNKPSSRIEAEASAYANKVFTKLMNEKNDDGSPAYMLRVNMDQCLIERGIWTDSIASRLMEVTKNIQDLEDKIYKGGMSKKEGREIALKLKTARLEQIRILSARNQYDENTVEGKVDNAKFDYLVTKCVLFSDGSPIFNSVDEYRYDEDIAGQLFEAIGDLGSMVSRYDPNFEKKLPENKFLLKYGFVNDDLRYINEDGKLVDIEGKLVDQDGNYIDEEGNPIEVDNPLDKEIGEFTD